VTGLGPCVITTLSGRRSALYSSALVKSSTGSYLGQVCTDRSILRYAEAASGTTVVFDFFMSTARSAEQIRSGRTQGPGRVVRAV
jgi:hypothetical protein